MATINVSCVKCKHTSHVIKYGRSISTGAQRFHCKECKHTFLLDYQYNARKPWVPKTIIHLTMNGSGIRDTARVLKISVATVITHIKNSFRNTQSSGKRL